VGHRVNLVRNDDPAGVEPVLRADAAGI